MWKVALKSTWAHKRRLIGTVAAVVLGIAFLAGTLVLSDTMRAGFDELFTESNAGIDAVVRGEAEIEAEMGGQAALVDGSVVEDIQAVDGVATAEAQIVGVGQIVGADGTSIGGNGPPTLAVNWIDNSDLSSYELVDGGRAPEAPGEVVIDVDAAETGDLAVGDSTIVRTPAPVEVEIVGLMEITGGGGQVTYAAFTFDDAQRYLMGGQDKVTSVLLAAEPGVSQQELVDGLQPVMPDGIEAITGAEYTEEATESIGDDFLNFFEAFLLVFAGIALFVAMFSIYNTFSITVAQRIRESALLRAVGSSRAQILVSILFEALVVGIVASAIGLVAGVGLSMGLKALLDAFGLSIPATGPIVAPSTVLWSFVIGIGVTMLASILPAVRASRVPPLAALRDVAIDRSDTSVARAVIGALFTVVGAGLVISAILGGGGVLLRAGLGAVALLIGIVVLGPIAARPMSAILGSPLPRLRGVTGQMARQNAMRNPRRTAGTASALMVGVAVVTLFTVVAASIKASIDEEVSRSFGGDLVVATTGFSGSGLDPAMAAEINELPEVERAVGIGLGAAIIDGEERVFSVADPAALASVLDVEVRDGSLGEMGDNAIAVAEDTAESAGYEVGSEVTMDFLDGQSESVTIGAIYSEGAGNSVSTYIVPTDLWAPHTPVQVDISVLITLADGVDIGTGRAAVEEVTAGYGEPEVQDRDEYVEMQAGGIDLLLNIVYVMLALAIVIALMGISNTLSLSVHERTRELGLLRAVGQTRPQTRSMVRWESVVVALFGTVGGLALGTFLGWALMRAIRAEEGIGTFAAPVGQLVLVLALGAVVGIIAAIRPARRAARLDVLQAIATE